MSAYVVMPLLSGVFSVFGCLPPMAWLLHPNATLADSIHDP